MSRLHHAPPCDTCPCPAWGLECTEHRKPTQSPVQETPTHSGPGYDLLPLPARGDAVEQWLKAQRDEHVDGYGPTPGWYALDRALNRYRIHAESGTPLDQDINAEVPF